MSAAAARDVWLLATEGGTKLAGRGATNALVDETKKAANSGKTKDLMANGICLSRIGKSCDEELA